MSKHYSIRILLYLLATIALSIGTYILLAEQNYLAAIFLTALAISFILGIFHNIHAVNRKLAYFFSALENDDYTIRFIENEGVKSERMLNSILNQLKTILQNTRIDIQQREKYYELIINSVNSGIVALDNKGFVTQSNQIALKLLGLGIFTHVRQLEKVSVSLQQLFTTIKPGENHHVTYTNERGTVQLLVNATSIKLRGKEILLLVLNDIENEMNEKEIESWIRLIRVLSHEIMNSIAPITSLSDTLLAMHKGEEPETNAEQLRQNTINGLQVIRETGKGLITFIESYRKFTRIPTPSKEIINIREFIHRIVLLCSMEPNFKNIKINIEIHPATIELYADPNLLGQVLINLVKNAIQSLGNRPHATITLTAQPDTNGKNKITITDNGPGIPPEILNEIFIPFFTTKTEGSGIGLSIARQIIRAHAGTIKAHSTPEKETTFILIL